MTAVKFDYYGGEEPEYNPTANKQEEYSYKPQQEEDQYKTAYESEQPKQASKVKFDDDEDNDTYNYKP